MKVLVIDNYDSFTYNLVAIVREAGLSCDVVRNNRFELDQVAQYDRIILSPGPGVPADAGSMEEVIRQYSPKKSILGVCLGHQGIGEVFGGKLQLLGKVYHGIGDEITVTSAHHLFDGLDQRLAVGRYHSWVIDQDSVPDCLEVTARTDDGTIMAIRHRTYDVHGVQFHPESILTPEGDKMILNFLSENRAG